MGHHRSSQALAKAGDREEEGIHFVLVHGRLRHPASVQQSTLTGNVFYPTALSFVRQCDPVDPV